MRMSRTNTFHDEMKRQENSSISWEHDASSDTESMLQDQIRVMFQLESKYNALHVTSSSGSILEREQHGEWRGKICEWCYRVVDHYEYDREVVSIAMDYFDRFIVSQQDQNKIDDHCDMGSMPSRKYQLAAMTSLYVAIKLHAEVGGDSCDINESRSAQSWENDLVQTYQKTALKLSSYVELSRGQFNASDVLHMERKILASLNWKVNPITPMSFVSYLFSLFPRPCTNHQQQKRIDIVLHVLHELSRYLTELAICLPGISNTLKPILSNRTYCKMKKAYAPSSIAYASILVSMDLITLEALPVSIRQEFTQKISMIAFEASSFTNDNEHFYFNPDSDEIKELKSLIKRSFHPEDVLQGADEGGEEYLQHPITIAKVGGFLNIRREPIDDSHWSNRNYESQCKIDMYKKEIRSSGSPTSVSRISKISSGSRKLFRLSR